MVISDRQLSIDLEKIRITKLSSCSKEKKKRKKCRGLIERDLLSRK